MKPLVLILASASLVLPCGASAQNNAPAPKPVVWGAFEGNRSCVIFAEGHKTSGRFYGVAVTTKTIGKLTLIETVNYTFADKETLETQENMDRLNEMAQKDRVKFVKIPEKYSPDLLDQARAACKADAQ